MTDQVNVLSIRAALASDDYVRGAQQIQSANKAMSASAAEAGTNVIQFETKVSNAASGIGRLTRAYDQAGASQAKFQADIRALNTALDQGKVSAEQAGAIYAGMVQKLGLVANGSQIAAQGFTKLGEIIGEVNQKAQGLAEAALAAQEFEKATAATAARVEQLRTQFDPAYVSAQRMTQELENLAEAERLGIQLSGGYEAALNGIIQKYDATGQAAAKAAADQKVYLDQLRAQQAGQNFHADLDARFGIGAPKSDARASASVFEEQAAKIEDLRRRVDPTYAAAERLAAGINDLNEAQRQGIEIAGGYDAAFAALTSTYDKVVNAASYAARAQQEYFAQLKAQQSGQNFASDLNARLGIGSSGTDARASAAVFEEQAQAADALNARLATLRATIDPIGASWAAMNKQIAEYNDLLRAGNLSTEEFAKLEDLARNRHEQFVTSLNQQPGGHANDNLAAFRRQDLGFQANDIIQGLISGQPIGQVIAQQSGQIIGAYQQAGGLAAVKSDLAALGGVASTVAGAISPIGLALAGVTAAAGAFYLLTRTEAKSTEQVLKEQEASIRALGDAYDFAAERKRAYSQTDKTIALAAAQQDQSALQAKQTDVIDALRSQFGSYTSFGRSAPTFTLLPQYSAFASAFNDLKSKADLPKFIAEIKQIGDENGFQEQAQKIIATANGLADFQNKLATGGAAILFASWSKGLEDIAKAAGKAKDAILATWDLTQAQNQRAAQLGAIGAKTPQELADAARAQFRTTPYAKDEIDNPALRQYREDTAAAVAYKQAVQQLTDAQDARVYASKASLAQAQFELSISGQSIEMQNRLRAAEQAKAQIEAANFAAHAKNDPAEIAAAQQKAAAVADLNAQIQAQKMLTDQGYQFEQLQLQANLIGKSADEVARLTAALQAKQEVEKAGIPVESQLGQQYIANAEAMAHAQQEIQRQQAAYQSLQQAEGSMIDTFTAGITGMGGTWKDTLKNMASQFLQWIDQLAIANPLKNWLTGTNLPTLADLFSGKPTVPTGQTTGTMTVTAGTVMINGVPLGGLPGLPGTVPGQTQGGLAGLIGYNPAASANGVRPTLTTGGIVNSPVPLAANQNIPATDVTSYIQQAAIARGIDPNTALAVARSEGGLSTWNLQSRAIDPKTGLPEQSYGPYQLYMNGGLGNQFQAQTGLNPALAQNGPAGVDFALDYAAKNGWSSWHGAANTGISDWQGIGPNAHPIGQQQSQVLTTNMTKLADTTNTAATNLTTLGDSSKTLNTTFSDFLKQPATPQNAPFPAAPQGPNYFPPAPTAPGSFSLSGLFGGIPLIGPLFSSLFHLFGFADGTDNAPGGLSLVGERGPELVNLPRGSQVFTNPQTKQMLAGGGGGGHTKVSVGVTVDNDGNLKAYVKSVAHSTASAVSADHVAAGIDTYRREGLYADIDHYQSDPYSRGAA